ncbi:hypothetical protein VP01_13772g1, partial [Puccinia sorghi]
PPAQMLRDLREKSVTKLCELQVEFGKGKRLTKEIKDKLREITLDYQKKSRGLNRFNSFCLYGPEIHIAESDNLLSFEELPPGERMQVVAEIWRSMDKDERLQYDDWGFLNSLRAQMGLRPLKDGVND